MTTPEVYTKAVSRNDTNTNQTTKRTESRVESGTVAQTKREHCSDCTNREDHYNDHHNGRWWNRNELVTRKLREKRVMKKRRRAGEAEGKSMRALGCASVRLRVCVTLLSSSEK